MLSTILVAVPALRRVEPAMISGPTAGAICRSTKFCSSDPGQQVTKMIFAPALRARVRPPRTNGVMPLADTPTTRRGVDSRRRPMLRAPFLEVVLDAFLGPEHGLLAAGHDRLHERRRRAEGRRHLGRFDDAESSAGAGADEDEPSALAERLDDDLDAVRDPLLLFQDGGDDLPVLVHDHLDDVADRASCRLRG